MNLTSEDSHWMQEALMLAKTAVEAKEVPVGALLVLDKQIIGRGWNQPISACDPTAHAEIIAMRTAARDLGNYRLPAATLYVTLEPCAMCAGAMIQARVKRLVFGAFDPRAGAVGSVFNILQEKKLNHHVDCMGGVLQQECGEVLRNFFRERR